MRLAVSRRRAYTNISDAIAFGFRTLAFSVLFRKCREKSKLAERNPFFGNKTAGQRSSKQGSGRQCSDFPRTSENSCRKYAANSGIPEHTAFFG